jgi:hypothetical protein
MIPTIHRYNNHQKRVLRTVLTFVDVDYSFIHSTVEYQTAPSMKWSPAMYEQSVIVQLVETQFHYFVERVKTTDCQAELRRLLAAGPPIWVQDKHAMPLIEKGDTHIVKLWYQSDNQERTAKLDGAVDGEERQALWDELKEFIIVEGKEEGDDDNKTQAEEL